MVFLRSLVLLGLLQLNICLADHFKARSRPHRSGLNKAAGRQRDNLVKRDSSFTYFYDGLGACGSTNTDSDYIVAISAQDWDDGANCYETITITVDGQSTTATIVDECMGCASGDLDFSVGLFEYFSDLSVGVLSGSWSYSSGDSSSDDTATTSTTEAWVDTTTTSQWVDTETSTSTTAEWTPTTTSSTEVWTPTTTSTTSTYVYDAPTTSTTTTKKSSTRTHKKHSSTSMSSSSSVWSSSSTSSSSSVWSSSSAPASSSVAYSSSPASASTSSSYIASSGLASESSTSTSTSDSASSTNGVIAQLDTALIQLAGLLIAAQTATDD